jgi:hypothetical protein
VNDTGVIIDSAPLISEQHRLLLSAGTFFATDHTAHGGAGIEEIVEVKEALVRECGLTEEVATRWRLQVVRVRDQ